MNGSAKVSYHGATRGGRRGGGIPHRLADIPSFPYHSQTNKKPCSMASQHPIAEASAKYPKPAERTFQYGTAGVSLSKI